MDSSAQRKDSAAQERREGNTCLALGAGVGALGAVGAAVSGAVCPACIVVVPGLIGLGAFKRWRSGRKVPGSVNEPPSS